MQYCFCSPRSGCECAFCPGHSDGWEWVDSFCPCPVGDGMLVVDITNDPDEQPPKQATLEPGDKRLFVELSQAEATWQGTQHQVASTELGDPVLLYTKHEAAINTCVEDFSAFMHKQQQLQVLPSRQTSCAAVHHIHKWLLKKPFQSLGWLLRHGMDYAAICQLAVVSMVSSIPET